jgi:hypothetical protein
MKLRVGFTGLQSALTKYPGFAEIDGFVVAVVGSVVIDYGNLLALRPSFQRLPGDSNGETVVWTFAAGGIEGVDAKGSMRELRTFG